MQKDIIGEKTTGARMLYLILGIVIALIAFLVPMDIFGMYHMFTVHMAEHLLISLAVPPLLLLSLSTVWLRQFLGRHKVLARCIAFLTIPFVAGALFNATIWILHAPVIMAVMMSSEPFHVLTNILYLLTGCIFWWPLLNPLHKEQHTLSLGGKLAYLFFSDMPMMLIGAGMTFSAPLYAFSMTNPTMYMVVPAADQQLGGLLMWVAGSIFFIIIASILFLRWMLQQEKEQREREQALDQEELAEEEAASLELG